MIEDKYAQWRESAQDSWMYSALFKTLKLRMKEVLKYYADKPDGDKAREALAYLEEKYLD